MRFAFRRWIAEPLDELRRRPPGQLGGLDALRTLAVLLVICGHASGSYFQLGGERTFLWRWAPAGWIGVDLFFVLSGYLIGKQLWREWGQSGTIRFWRFFLRRGLRIWPLYFFFLAFVALALGRGRLPFGRGWSDLVFLTNYVNQGVVIGSWSLCTEEQFYLLAPLLLIVSASRARSLASYRQYLWIGLAALPVVRAITWWRLTGDFSMHDPELFKRHLYQPIHLHCDGLLMGLILSNLAAERRDVAPRSSLRYGAGLLVLSCVALVGLRAMQREVFNFTGLTLVLGALTSLALRDIGSAGILQARPFYWLSRLSYGMYLNHAYLHEPLAQFAVAFIPGMERAATLHFIATESLVVASSVCFAVVTFCLIEHPFLRLRNVLLERSKAGRTSPEAGAAELESPA
ncbi:MAG TPA: acyltransferase, partial [Pirellulales bacterium]|nr:acyltransferase [Pirellulales bacterium]